MEVEGSMTVDDRLYNNELTEKVYKEIRESLKSGTTT